MSKDDITFMLNNYEHNLEEPAGLFINGEGKLCELLSNIEEPILGLYGGVILEQGGYGLLLVDYIHQQAS
jgi:hypothetical protein